MPPVTEVVSLTYACDNFATCGTPAVVGATGTPPGWSDNTINGVRVILCPIDTPAVAAALPSATALQAAATATELSAQTAQGKLG